ASGHSMVYVNGEPRMGDPYQTGYVRIPVLLRAGTNGLLFQASRGRLKATLTAPKADALLNTADSTLPDLVLGEAAEAWGAVVVVNATQRPLRDLALRATCGGRVTPTPLPSLPPLSLRKVGFRIDSPPASEGTTRELRLELQRGGRGEPQLLDTATVALRVRRPDQTRKITFRTEFDCSIHSSGPTPPPP